MPIQKSVFMAGVKFDISVMFLISAGRAFYSRGPATEKALPSALPPNFILVQGMSYSVVIAERSRRCPVNDEIGVSIGEIGISHTFSKMAEGRER